MKAYTRLLCSTVILLALFAACKKSSNPKLPGSGYAYLIAGTHSFHRLDYVSQVSGYSDSVTKADTSFAIDFVDSGTIAIGAVKLIYDSSYMYRDSILHFYYNGKDATGTQQMGLLAFDRYTNYVTFTMETFIVNETGITYFSSF